MTLLLRDFVGILTMIPKIQDMKMQKLYIFFEHFCEMWTLSAKAKKETMIFHTRPPGVLINTFDPFCNFRGSRIHLQWMDLQMHSEQFCQPLLYSFIPDSEWASSICIILITGCTYVHISLRFLEGNYNVLQDRLCLDYHDTDHVNNMNPKFFMGLK